MNDEQDETGEDLPESGELPVWAVKIQELAAATGLTHAELARRAGMTRDAFHRYATGKTRPPTERVYQLADLFGVPDGEIDPTRLFLRKRPTGMPARSTQPYTISAPLSGDPDLVHIKLEMDLRHGTLAKVMELIADERKWELSRKMNDDGEA